MDFVPSFLKFKVERGNSMKYKNFKYKEYKKCYFEVGTYFYNHSAMSIEIKSEDGEDIATATVNMPDYMYYPGTATIKNYSENAGMTKFLKKLGIIEEIYSSRKCNIYATSNNETIDFCSINIEKLKEYSKEFDYEYQL